MALPNGLGCESWAVALTHSDLEGHVLGKEEGNLPLQPATWDGKEKTKKGKALRSSPETYNRKEYGSMTHQGRGDNTEGATGGCIGVHCCKTERKLILQRKMPEQGVKEAGSSRRPSRRRRGWGRGLESPAKGQGIPYATPHEEAHGGSWVGMALQICIWERSFGWQAKYSPKDHFVEVVTDMWWVGLTGEMARILDQKIPRRQRQYLDTRRD